MKLNSLSETLLRWLPLVLSLAALVIALNDNSTRILPQVSSLNDHAALYESQQQIKRLADAVQSLQAQQKRVDEHIQALAHSTKPVRAVAQTQMKPLLPVDRQSLESDQERLAREQLEFDNSPQDNKTKIVLETQFARLLADKRFKNAFLKRIDCRVLGCKIEFDAQGADASQLATDLLFQMENPPDNFSISPGDDDGEPTSTVVMINHS